MSLEAVPMPAEILDPFVFSLLVLSGGSLVLVGGSLTVVSLFQLWRLGRIP